MEDEKFPISYVHGKFLVFDVQAVEVFRKNYHILGTLVGTLPQLPQQNVFLGLPMELSKEEAFYLIEKGISYIVDDTKVHKQLLENTTKDDVKQCLKKRQSLAYDQMIAAKKKENEKKIEIMKKLGRTLPLDPLNYDEHDSFDLSWIPVDTVTTRIAEKSSMNDDFHKEEDVFENLDINRYLMFKSLVDTGFYLNPGLRFGCQFVAYPGDALRYHSHYLVNSYKWDQEIPVLFLIGGGRLGTAVKKTWLIGGSNDRNINMNGEKSKEELLLLPVRHFSIEWAGFG
ncbi:tRNA-splicing endonuclease catalytic subunit Sen34 [Schizosaccharomyces pombe]|uniref:Probable tRNA-splicing endonuclease subunit sen34 n=1 Tax=Schizosaccharomyces pombe (strain 972 / ATCC 24843) TaxID=284812 RepID=SEN34_SCHPO|nr:putative tRNA-splicing endonuclease catalytic subunit Sen34 [Schizosaccharomyces pombe]O60156.1 RecName: Full=Probable tRNA-splicing endonuclease subunit sen34; AltName: Full=tRNA-intron endonuclease sen34 [Schizosaccharomyces pombe 972h-]CAA19575.1 tRNA-splicing endonuclease catalytic subunit Sen34 (predicted) [Schizosaccharomyces pombe]|eukprot:NP_596163.1 putative tRNA-splicing endonuclease catalytic subunit Sen34 [Schizosaccharomyces pombe]